MSEPNHTINAGKGPGSVFPAAVPAGGKPSAPRTAARWVAIALCLVAVAAAVAARGRIRRARRAARAPREIPVLMYHNVLPESQLEPGNVWQVSAEDFAAQMDELDRNGWTTILPDDLLRAAKGRCRLPDKAVVVTFDDGYEGVVRWAEPALAKHGFRAMVYVIVHKMSEDGEPRASFDNGPLLTKREIVEAAARGTLVVGAHSLTHAHDWAILAEEEKTCAAELFRLAGIKTVHYCHPYGWFGSEAMDRGIREGGFETALVCEERGFVWSPDVDLKTIPRYTVFGGTRNVRLLTADGEKGLVRLANDGAIPTPVRLHVGNGTNGESFVSARAVRIGGERPVAEFRVDPGLLSDGGWSIRATDYPGLFTYGTWTRADLPDPVVTNAPSTHAGP